MERHFMSRPGAVAHLVSICGQLDRKKGDAATEGEVKKIQERIESLRQLILDVRAGRVHAFRSQGVEVLIKE